MDIGTGRKRPLLAYPYRNDDKEHGDWGYYREINRKIYCQIF